MSHLILAGLSAIVTILHVKENITKLWKAGLIGVGIMLGADSLGIRLNCYSYPGGLLYIGAIPSLHIVYIYFFSILFLSWNPQRWDRRILYIIYSSTIFLAVEAVMLSAGAIAYHNWKITYSYLLINCGLLLLAYLSDFVAGNNFYHVTNKRAIK